jgi:hypothetical protein
MDQEHGRQSRPLLPAGRQVQVHGQLAAAEAGVAEPAADLDPVGVGQGMDERHGRVEAGHGADATPAG